MNVTELHLKIREAYKNENLNRICITLISLYKEQQFGMLAQITEMIRDSVDITPDPEGKFFSRLMMLYHPDRGNYHRSVIDKLAEANDLDGLLGYAHILKLAQIEEIAQSLSSYEDIDYSPVYEWDINLEGFTVVGGNMSNAGTTEEKKHKPNKGYSFYNAVKIRMFGQTKTSFPTHYLEDLDEIELAQSDITDLDGIQYCIHTLNMDLSGNRISDLSLLWPLKQLEEINLSDNRIEDIETLSNLKNLRTLMLNNNPVRDVSPLLNLSKLEYVELSGCRIPAAQLAELEDAGITVVSA